jgi:ubiquinone/menaquinone biosynthesis C-methylase UbiE
MQMETEGRGPEMTLKILLTIAALAALMIGANLRWRRASRHRSLPCPSWLAWTLESSLMGRLMGTQATLNRLYLQPGLRLLEVGPGPGRLLIPAARRVAPGGEAVGLDIQAGMVERLKVRASQAALSNLTAVLGDATQVHFLPESFDVIFLCTVLGEIPDREAALSQCYAALKVGGLLSITEIFPDPHYQDSETVRRIAEAVGFCLNRRYGSWLRFTMNFVKPPTDIGG